MLDPLVAQQLMAEVPEMQALRKHIAEEALKLNSLDGLEDIKDFKERAYEVNSRLRAYQTLLNILSPLIVADKPLSTPKPADSLVV